MFTTQKPPSVIEYKPQLDGLRFFAVFFVLIYHYLPIVRNLAVSLDLALFLVFFFVLSSFLITKILLISKEKGVAAGYSRQKIGLVFLIRRTLRIFPAYYFYLILLLLLPYAGQNVKDNAASFFLYLSNFHLYYTHEWGELTPHLWTLAVEEQFYLVWPWIILFTPDKHLTKVFYFFTGVGILSRAVLYAQMKSPELEFATLQVLTPTCIDAFSLGALLAYQHVRGKTYNPIYKWLLLPCFLIFIYNKLSHQVYFIFFERTFVALLAVVVIEGASKGYKNWFGWLLENKVVLYLAKISYGIYLYHIITAYLFWKFIGLLNNYATRHFQLDLTGFVNFMALPAVSFFIYFFLSVVLAALSWHLLEKPISNFKKLFMYNAPAKNRISTPGNQPANEVKALI